MGKFSQDAALDAIARKYREQLGGAAPISAAPPNSVTAGLLGDGGSSTNIRPKPSTSGRNPTNPVGWVLDVLSRGSYAVGQTAREMQGNLRDGFDLADLSPANPANMIQNLVANDKETPSDVLLENWKPERDSDATGWANVGQAAGPMAARLGIDILMDPLTYVPGAAIVSGARGVAKAGGLLKEGATTARKARPIEDEAIPAPAAANAAPEVAEPLELAGRIPESRQIEAGTPALPRTPSAASAPRTFEQPPKEAAPAPDPNAPARTFLMELAEDTKTVAAAKKVTQGKFVPKPSAETAAEINTARVAEGIEQPRTALQNVKSGEIVPFSKKLAALTTARKQYPDLDIQPPFRPGTIDDVPVAATPEPAAISEAAPAATPDKPLSIMEWATQAAKNGETYEVRTPGSQGTVKAPIAQIIENTKSTDARRKAAAAKNIRAAYMDYVRNFKPGTIETPPTAPSAQVERTAAVEAARARSEAIPAFVRLTGDEWTQYKKDLATKVSSEDYTRLIRQKKPESFNKVLEEMKSRKIRTPTFVPVVLDITPEKIADDVAKSVPELPEGVIRSKRTEPKDNPAALSDQSVINDAKTDLPTANERMATMPILPPEVASGGAMSDAAGNALMRAIQGQQWDGIKPDFQWRTNIQQSLKNSPVYGKGNAVNRESANVMFQVNMFRGLMQHFTKAVPAELGGYARAEWLFKNVLPPMKEAEDFLKANGIMPVGSVLKEGYPISFSEVLEGLYKTRAGKEFIKGRIFDTGGLSPRGYAGIYGTIDPTSLMSAAHLIAEHLGKAVNVTDAATLRAELNKILTAGEMRTRIEKSLSGARGVTSRKGEVPKGMQAAVIAQGADLFMQPEVVAHIFDRVMENTARFGVQFNAEVGRLTNDTMQNVVDILRTPLTSTGEAMHVITNTDEVVEAAAKVDLVTPEVADATKEAVRDTLTDTVKIQDIASAENRIKVSQKAVTGTREEVKEAAQKTYEADVAAAFSSAPVTRLMNLSDSTELAMQAGILGKMAPLMMKLNPAWGNATLHSAITTGGSVSKLLQKQWRHELSVINREHTKDELGNAIKWLQAGNDVTKAPDEFKAAALRLKPVMNQIFETDEVTGTSGVLSAFFREGFDVEHINQRLNYVYRDTGKVVPQFKPKTRDVKKWVRDRQGQLKQRTIQEPYYDAEVYNQWRGWDISDDPLDFMARMETAFAGIATDMAIAQEGFRIASSLGYASKTQRKGFVQIGDQATSVVARYMPKGAWFDPEILSEIKRMDEILSESTTLNGGFGRFVNQYLDPILNMWKSGMTVWRPGHHVRNFIGDSALSFYAHGVQNPAYYAKAMRMQILRGEYDGWSALQALQGLDRVPSGNAKAAVDVSVKIKGGTQKFTDADIFKGLMARGMLPDFRVQEDLLESNINPAIQRMQQRMAITGGRAKGVVGRVSEARDDTVRIAHALHLLENGITKNPKLSRDGKGFDSLEDALDQVAAQVKRYHPDGADLTGFERNVMRRLMPFYSWSRKAFPLIAEAILTQPGRVMVFPKATYAYAESQGIDLESMSNPFPSDQLFPSFIEDRTTGPLYKDDDGRYFGAQPGMPALDIIDDFVGNPKAGAIGMLNPFLKAPAELTTGHRADTGAEIHDVGEYVDSQIPGVSTFSSMAGVSATGTPWSILSGNGLDEQRAVERGNKEHFAPESILNYLTGLGVQNFSKPSYINIAEMEKRDEQAARRAKLKEQ